MPKERAESAAVPRLQGRTVLAVFAHPDDESLACGGTLRRLADLGARTVLLCASRGELGGSATDDPERVASTRASELASAAAVLGIAVVWLLRHPDGSLRWSDNSGLQAAITLAVRRFAPSLVITFGEDGLYWHPDHIGVHEQTVMAIRGLGRSAPALYGVTVPAGAMRGVHDAARQRGWTPPDEGFWSLPPDAWGADAPSPTIIADVTGSLPAKVAAISRHVSQVGSVHPLSMLDSVSLARWLGRELFHPIPTGTFNPPASDILGQLA